MAGFLGLGGHRHVGGLRSSTYNAVPLESAQELAKYIAKFEKEQSAVLGSFENLS